MTLKHVPVNVGDSQTRHNWRVTEMNFRQIEDDMMRKSQFDPEGDGLFEGDELCLNDVGGVVINDSGTPVRVT